MTDPTKITLTHPSGREVNETNTATTTSAAKPRRRLSLRVTLPCLGFVIILFLRFNLPETFASWFACWSASGYCYQCVPTGDDYLCFEDDTTTCQSSCIPGGSSGGGEGGGGSNAGGQGHKGPNDAIRRPDQCSTCQGSSDKLKRIENQSRYICDSQGNCSQAPGMPIWSVTEPMLNLWLQDTPLVYQPSRGDAIQLQLVYKSERDYQETTEDSTAFVFTFGNGWFGRWRCYVVLHNAATNTFDLYNGIGGRTTLTLNGSPSFRGQMTLAIISNNPVVQYPTGAQDVFAYSNTDANGVTRYFRTKHIDPVGNTTTFAYSVIGSAVCLTNITDVDNNSTTLQYSAFNGYECVTNVTDPYQHTASFLYDAGYGPPLLTNMTDVIQISSTLVYNTTTLTLTNLITPYATNQFLGLKDTSTDKGLLITVSGVHGTVRNYFYVYTDVGNTNYMTNSYAGWLPQTTNGSVYAFPNTFDP
ncbi:MAG: hypothetical protein KGS61_09990, partial [Verrucomicrobia bacterium]|nr:hypothetical protein [Verrucomicrobiota bacterium]